MNVAACPSAMAWSRSTVIGLSPWKRTSWMVGAEMTNPVWTSAIVLPNSSAELITLPLKFAMKGFRNNGSEMLTMRNAGPSFSPNCSIAAASSALATFFEPACVLLAAMNKRARATTATATLRPFP